MRDLCPRGIFDFLFIFLPLTSCAAEASFPRPIRVLTMDGYAALNQAELDELAKELVAVEKQ